MDRGLFRTAAVERLSTPDRLDQPVRITPVWAWLAIVALLVLTAAGTVASVVIIVPEKVQGDGIVISSTGIQEVPFPSSGRLMESHAQTGDYVKRDSLVARIEQPELRRAYKEAQKIHRDIVQQRQRVAAFHAQVRAAQDEADARRQRDLEQSRTLIRRRLGFLHERAGIDIDLGARRLITRAQIVDTKVAIGAAEEELAAVERQANEIALDATNARIRDQRELLDLDMKIEAAARQATLLEEQLRQAEEVVSP